MVARTLALALAVALVGCGSDPIDLTVDVRTDWRASRDFCDVLTEVSSEPLREPVSPAEVRQETLRVTGTEPWLDGVRVAELTDVGRGALYVRVTLRSAAGRAIAQRVLALQLESSFAATVLLTRTCRDVVCPAPAGAPELSECQGGACVDPRCSPSTPEFCPPEECVATSECGVVPDCGGPVECSRGYCLCADDGPPPDAGFDAGRDGGYDAGRDAGRDGGMACGAIPAGQPCDDGDECTTGDVCTAGRCAGSMRTCNDGNPCTADSCNPATGCVATPMLQHSTCGATYMRCCSGACIDTRTSSAHCGGCGHNCATGHTCEIYDSISACTCTASSQCRSPNGVCSPTYGYHCACENDLGCASGLVCEDRAGAINYCHY